MEKEKLKIKHCQALKDKRNGQTVSFIHTQHQNFSMKRDEQHQDQLHQIDLKLHENRKKTKYILTLTHTYTRPNHLHFGLVNLTFCIFPKIKIHIPTSRSRKKTFGFSFSELELNKQRNELRMSIAGTQSIKYACKCVFIQDDNCLCGFFFCCFLPFRQL